MKDIETTAKKRKSGIPTGNAGEYFVMGELLRRGFDAQLADRNTKGYDLLVGKPRDATLKKVQVKAVRSPPWYVRANDFQDDAAAQVTIYVLIGPEKVSKPIRYFIAKNEKLSGKLSQPRNWKTYAFVGIKNVSQYEVTDKADGWNVVLD